MSTSKFDIAALQIKIGEDRVTYGQNESFPVKASTLKILKGNTIPFIVAWIILIIAVVQISRAQTIGRRLQEECGEEYLERESMRYLLVNKYKSIRASFNIVVNLLLGALVVLYIAAILEYLRANKAIGIAYKQLGNPQLRMPKFLGMSIFKFVLPALAFGGIAIYGAAWASEIGVWNGKISKYNTRITKSVAKGLQALLYIMYLTFILYVSVLMFVFSKYKIQSHLGPILIFGLFIIGVIFIYLQDYFDLHNSAIVPYAQAGNDMNKYLGLLLKNNSQKYTITQYLQDNIKRDNPKVEGDPIIDNYKDEWFSYTMHRRGNEILNINESNAEIDVYTLKRLWKPFVFGMLRSRSDISRDVPRNTEETDNSYFARLDSMYAVDYAALKSQLGNIIERESNPSVKEVSIPGTVTYTRYGALVREFMANALLSDAERTDTVVPKETIFEVIDMYTNVASDKKQNVKDMFTRDTRLRDCKLKFKQAVGTNNIPSHDYANDLYSLTCLHMKNLDQKSMSVVSVKDVIDEGNLADDLRSLVRKQLEDYSKGLTVTKFQTLMRKLRSIDGPMKDGASKFIKHIFWLSVIVIFSGAFLLFHKLYTRTEDTAEHIKMYGSLFILTMVIIVSTYAWFMGNVK
jgi:hypothetical protein